MAIINDKHNFIYIHIYKTGGTSLRQILPKTTYVPNHVPNFWQKYGSNIPKHWNAEQVKRLLNDNRKWESMFKFAFVRNPFEWNLSLFKYIKTNEHPHNSLVQKGFLNWMKIWQEKVHRKEEVQRGNLCQTQYDFLYDANGDILVDYVGKMETFNKDIDYISNQIGIKTNIIPHINKSSAEKEDFRKYYCDESYDIVLETFAKDFHTFEYAWEKPNSNLMI